MSISVRYTHSQKQEHIQAHTHTYASYVNENESVMQLPVNIQGDFVEVTIRTY